MTFAPRVSVIMPLFNGAAYLTEALESLRAQTLPVAEVVAIDDGSTDDSAAIAARYPFVTVVRKEHSGIGATLNRGVEAATGDHLAFLDQDDRWLPDKNRLQVEALRANPALDFVTGHVRQFRSTGLGADRIETPLAILRGVSKLCLLIRRSSFDRVGEFSTAQRHDFLDWYCRAQEAGLKGEMLPEIVAERRIHGANYGMQNREHEHQTYFRALKASLDRRRAAGGGEPLPPSSP